MRTEAPKEFTRILSRLNDDGYVVVEAPHHYDDLKNLAGKLGRVSCETEVRVFGATDSYVRGASEIPLHNDNVFEVRYVGLYCVAQDPRSGATQIVDVSRLKSQLPAEVLWELSKIKIPISKPGFNFNSRPFEPLVLNVDDDTPFHYTPEFELNEPFRREHPAVRILFEEVGAIARDSTISIRLEAGQSLLFDNWRVLHARPRLSDNSIRHLKRFWIDSGIAYQTPDKDGGNNAFRA